MLNKSAGGSSSYSHGTAGNAVIPSAGTSALKPTRNTFKVPADGQYELIGEITLNPSKFQRKSSRAPATRFSYVIAKEVVKEDATKEQEPESEPSKSGELSKSTNPPRNAPKTFFAYNIADLLPMYTLKNDTNADYEEKGTPLSFRVHPSCHDFNKTTSSNEKLELLIGFDSGDILIYDTIKRSIQAQFNKEPRAFSGKVTDIQWLPGSRTYFVATFSSGVLVVFDRTRDEPPPSSVSSNAKDTPTGESFAIVKQKNPKLNPVAKWYISTKTLNGFAFSPDGAFLATVGQDGLLRIFNFDEEILLVSFRSYYGGFLSACWSPDGKYVVTGGEDDMVSVWSLQDRCIMARGQGHKSFVGCVRFDPWHCDGNSYRFGSVGEDSRLLLWDFSQEIVRRPRFLSMSFGKLDFEDKKSGNTDKSAGSQDKGGAIKQASASPHGGPVVESLPRNEVAQINPLVELRAHHEPVSDLLFMKNMLVTCSWGKAKFWRRPDPSAPLSPLLSSGSVGEP